MKPSHELKKNIHEAILACYAYDLPSDRIELAPTERAFEGTHTFTAFALAGKLQAPVEEVGRSLGDWLVAKSEWVQAYQVVKGFVNLTLSQKAWEAMLEEVGTQLSYQYPRTGRKVVVEFSQPNTNKPLHLGHLRNDFLGSAVTRILKEVGHTVSKVNIMNDRGIHICKSMVAYERFGQGHTPASQGMKGDHLVGHYYVLFEQAYQKEIATLTEASGDREQAKKEAPIMQAAQAMLKKWEDGDEAVRALWQKMNGWVIEGFEATYKRTHTTFDKVYYESNTYLLGKEVVKEGLDKGIFYTRADGSVWVDLEDVNLGEKLLLRGNGTTVYMTQDMGAIDERYQDFGFDEHVYVVGNEQDRHFQVLFEIMKRLGRPYADKLYHLSYGMVDLPTGKMKSREGNTVDADHLIDEMVATAEEMTQALGKGKGFAAEEGHRLYDMLGVGAIKYFLLRVNPKKRLLFNPKESIDFQGHTAAFIQYTHARICTVLTKAGWKDTTVTTKKWQAPLCEAEHQVILQLSLYPKQLEDAAQHHNPALLAEYAYQLAKVYNRLYGNVRILHAEDKEAGERRLYLSWVTARLLKKSMGLLGIEVPTRM